MAAMWWQRLPVPPLVWLRVYTPRALLWDAFAGELAEAQSERAGEGASERDREGAERAQLR